VIEALIRARDRGLRVEILLNGMTAHTGAQPPPWDKRFRRPLKPAIQQLKDAWVQIFYVYYHESIYSPLHHKFAVIDGLTVITGSYNWYEPSILSDEVLSIVRDERIAAAFLEEAGLMRGCFRTEME
jgi:phosphatidylserine/phosphatidylglycerophosphate/cardiolipin synthase-like enzyme